MDRFIFYLYLFSLPPFYVSNFFRLEKVACVGSLILATKAGRREREIEHGFHLSTFFSFFFFEGEAFNHSLICKEYKASAKGSGVSSIQYIPSSKFLACFANE